MYYSTSRYSRVYSNDAIRRYCVDSDSCCGLRPALLSMYVGRGSVAVACLVIWREEIVNRNRLVNIWREEFVETVSSIWREEIGVNTDVGNRKSICQFGGKKLYS